MYSFYAEISVLYKVIIVSTAESTFSVFPLLCPVSITQVNNDGDKFPVFYFLSFSSVYCLGPWFLKGALNAALLCLLTYTHFYFMRDDTRYPTEMGQALWLLFQPCTILPGQSYTPMYFEIHKHCTKIL